MRTSTFVALAAVTVVVAGAAVWAVSQRGGGVTEVAGEALLYPDLRGRLNDVTELRVRSVAEGTVTVRRDGEQWELVEKHGYPVSVDRVRRTLIDLARLETVEPKTRRPEKWGELGLRALDDEKATGIQVTAVAGEDVLADLVVGDSRPQPLGGVFVRRADEEQTWLASGSFQPEKRPLLWLDRNVVNIDSRRIWRAEIRHPDGDVAAVERKAPADEHPALASAVPEGKVAKPGYEMNGVAGIGDFLIFEDVKPASELPADAEPVVTELATMDGLVVRLSAVSDERDLAWVTVEATTGPRFDGIDEFVAEHAGKDSAEGRIAGQIKAAEAVAAEAEEINARTEGWAYRLTEYKSGKVVMRAADLVQDPAEAEAEGHPRMPDGVPQGMVPGLPGSGGATPPGGG